MINDPDPGSDAAPYLILAPALEHCMCSPTPTGWFIFYSSGEFFLSCLPEFIFVFYMSRVIWEERMNSILNIGGKQEIINPLRLENKIIFIWQDKLSRGEVRDTSVPDCPVCPGPCLCLVMNVKLNDAKNVTSVLSVFFVPRDTGEEEQP